MSQGWRKSLDKTPASREKPNAQDVVLHSGLGPQFVSSAVGFEVLLPHLLRKNKAPWKTAVETKVTMKKSPSLYPSC